MNIICLMLQRYMIFLKQKMFLIKFLFTYQKANTVPKQLKKIFDTEFLFLHCYFVFHFYRLWFIKKY